MPTQPQQLAKTYSPAETEPRIRQMWDRGVAGDGSGGAFHADPERVLSGERRPYCVLIPPPNVTGALHLGHALNNTIQDILVRAHRMMGYETLWIVGTDHAGIATQAVVERRLRKEGKLKGPLKDAMTREQFVEQVQLWKDEYEARITNQLKMMGASCDYARQRFTMDDICARAVREAFFGLFRDGLIYRGKRLVNWDPALQTAVADDECEDIEVDAHFYYLRYPLVHAEKDAGGKALKDPDPKPVTWSELVVRGYPDAGAHPPEQQAWVTVATTRPETYLGDVAVGMNPCDPRFRALENLWVELPLVGRLLPIVKDEYVVLPKSLARDEEEANDPKAEFATGFLKVTPAHDQNDYDLYQRNKEIIDRNSTGTGLINIMAPDASISDKHGWGGTDLGDAHIFIGMTREAARKKVLDEFYARGLLEETKPYRHTVKHSDRSKAAIEPYLSDQWFVKVTDERLAGWANEALVAEQRTRSTATSGPGLRPGLGSSGSTGESASGSGHSGPEARSTGPFASLESHTATPKWAFPITRDLRRSRRFLPHWEKGGSTYWLTFNVLKGEMSERERQIALDSCLFWHQNRLDLHLVVVMPDHVHMIMRPIEKSPGVWWSLSELLHSIKSYSAHEIQKIRGATGAFWQDEHHDRLLRDADEFWEKWEYMVDNPRVAGLVKRPEEYAFLVAPERGPFGPEARSTGPSASPSAASDTTLHSGPGLRPGQGSSDSSNRLRFFPSRYAKTYEQWHDNIRDWCISRQLWWGHRVPVFAVYTNETQRPSMQETCRATDDLFRPWARANGIENEVAWYVPEDDSSNVSAFLCVRTEKAGDAMRHLQHAIQSKSIADLATPTERQLAESIEEIDQDPDVLDTWFSSALWPLSTLGWPDPNQSQETKGLLQAFNPTSLLSTAREIITLWVSRMVMFNQYFLGEATERRSDGATKGGPSQRGPVPFREVFIHAVVQDGDGKKMSKTAGNGVDPLDIIESHGADAMRFTLCHMTTQTQDVRMPVVKDSKTGKNTSPKFDLGRNFCNKLWNAARFALGILQSDEATERQSDEVKDQGGTRNDGNSPPSSLRRSVAPSLPLVDRWMLSRLHSAVAEIDAALGDYQFASYAQTLYDILWRDFCDWYLEAIKPTAAENPAQRAVLAHSLETIVRLLHPVAPFVTEAIWEHLKDIETAPIDGITLGPSRVGGLLATAGWPRVDPKLRDQAAEREFERVRGIVTAIREVRSQHQVAPKRRITLHAPASLLDALRAGGGLAYVQNLAGLEQVTPDGPAPGTTKVVVTYDAQELTLTNLADAVDESAEKDRLTKELADKTKSAETIAKRLENPGYMAKAPAKLVEESKQQLAALQAEIAAIKDRLASLG